MLEKITNINSESAYKNEKRGGNFLPVFTKTVKHSDLGNDAIKISPVLQYILDKGWQLKELKEINSRKISIKFLFAGFEFQADVDFDKLMAGKKIEYIIVKERNTNEINQSIMVNLTFNINKSFLIDENQSTLINLKETEVLFERISQLDLESEINSFDTYAIKSLMDDIYEGLVYELNYITSNLLLLFEKITKINCHFIKQEIEEPEIIKLDKIYTAGTGKIN